MSRSPVEVRFSRLNCVAVHLLPADPADLLAQFIRRVGSGSGGVYSGEVAVLDGSGWTHADAPPFGELLEAARQSGLLLAGARHWPQTLHAQIEAAGIALLEDIADANAETTPEQAPAAASAATAAAGSSGNAPASVAAETAVAPTTTPTTTPAASSISSVPTMLIDQPVRSGQKIYAKGCDAVVMGSVNPGAEIIADGNIHVYGTLRGRALAGASGNQKARIIATSFAPELVAIAGYYLTFENGFPADCENNPVKIHLENQASHLKIEPLNIR